jgi:hypothetical protein
MTVGSQTVAGAAMVINVSGLLSGDHRLTVGNNWTELNVSVSVGNDQTIIAGNGNGSVTITSPVVRDQFVTVGAGTGTITISGGTRNEVYTIGNGPRTVNLSGTISGTQTLILGNGITLNNTVVAPGGITVGGGGNNVVIVIGPTVSGPVSVNVGNNAAVTVTGATVSSLAITTGTDSAVTITGVTDTGNLAITMGDRATQLSIASSTFQGAGNNTITMGLGIDGVGSTFISIQNVTFTTGSLIVDAGAMGGNFTVLMVNVSVFWELDVELGRLVSTGTNMVFLQNVEALFGDIDGGGVNDTDSSDTIFDLGGNLGLTYTNFEGMF